MSANPRSPESGDVPEAIQKRIDLVRGLYADLFPNYTPTEYEEARLVLNVDAVAIHWLDDERSRLTAELSTARARADSAVQTVAFFASCIQSGESWSPTCEAEMQKLRSSLPQSSEATDRAE